MCKNNIESAPPHMLLLEGVAARSRMRVFKYFAGKLTSVGTTTTGADI
jgi:hypothetical protein